MVVCLSSSCYLVLLVGLSFQGRPTVSGASVSIEALQEHGSQHVLNVALAEAAQGLTANDGTEDVLADSNSNYEDPNKGPCLPNEDVRTQPVLPTHPKQCHSLLLCTPLSTLCSVFEPRQRLKDDTLICIVFFLQHDCCCMPRKRRRTRSSIEHMYCQPLCYPVLLSNSCFLHALE